MSSSSTSAYTGSWSDVLVEADSALEKANASPSIAIQNGADDKEHTLMLRNIPNNKTHGDIRKLLDKHFDSTRYNAIALPPDLGNPQLSDYEKGELKVHLEYSNNGYAFVNFRTKRDADRCKTLLNGFEWEDSKRVTPSRRPTTKVLHILDAKDQGLNKLVEKHRNSQIWHRSIPPCADCRYLLFNEDGSPQEFPVGDPQVPERWIHSLLIIEKQEGRFWCEDYVEGTYKYGHEKLLWDLLARWQENYPALFSGWKTQASENCTSYCSTRRKKRAGRGTSAGYGQPRRASCQYDEYHACSYCGCQFAGNFCNYCGSPRANSIFVQFQRLPNVIMQQPGQQQHFLAQEQHPLRLPNVAMPMPEMVSTELSIDPMCMTATEAQLRAAQPECYED
jgi:hypothetical protein